jgi:thiol-disulfide isomerase/thioredoxin
MLKLTTSCANSRLLVTVMLTAAGWMLAHPPGSEASEQVAPDGQPFAVVGLELVQGLEDVQRARQPLPRNLQSVAPTDLETGALLDGEWRFGAIPLPRNDHVDFAVSPDRKELFFDANHDARLEPEEHYRFSRIEGPNLWFDVDVLVHVPTEDGARELPVPVSLGFARKAEDSVLFRLNAYRRGVLERDGLKRQMAIIDHTFTDWFSDKRHDVLLIDVDGDGIFDVSRESHERYSLDEPIPFGETDLIVSDIGPLGATLTLARSERPARRLRSLRVGQPAVDFVGRQLDGGRFQLSEFSGQWVLLDFWATYCATCYRDFPHLKALNEQIPDLEVVGVAADYDPRIVERVVAAQGLSWRQVHDDDASVRDLFRVNFFPSSILVAPDGTIAAKNLRGKRLVSEFETAMLAWEDRQVAAARRPSNQ